MSGRRRCSQPGASSPQGESSCRQIKAKLNVKLTLFKHRHAGRRVATSLDCLEMYQSSYFDRTAEALSQATKTTIGSEQARLLDEALHFNELALTQEKNNSLKCSASSSNRACSEPMVVFVAWLRASAVR